MEKTEGHQITLSMPGCITFLVIGTFLVFLALKLMGYITWSWVWVFAPLWGVGLIVAAVLIVILTILLGAFVAKLVSNNKW